MPKTDKKREPIGFSGDGRPCLLRILNKYEPLFKKKGEGYDLIIYVLNGSVEMVINDAPCFGTEYDYFLIRDADSFSVKNIDHASIIVIFIKNEEVKDLFSYFGEQIIRLSEEEDVLFVSGDYNVKLKSDELISRILRNGDGDMVLSRLLAFEYISGIVRKLHRKRKSDEIPLMLVEAMKILRDPKNLREGVSAIENYTHYSRAQICRLVKKYYHVTPQEYINNLRLNFAYNMIVYSNQPIKSIATSVGYKSMSNFYKQFEKKYHILPTQIRS